MIIKIVAEKPRKNFAQEYFCPMCGKRLATEKPRDVENYRYCGRCGQKLKW